MASFRLEYEGDGESQQFEFEGESITVGRDKSSDFVLDHPTVSRQHAVIVREPEGFRLVVLSRGGLMAVDGEPIEGEVSLFDGTTLHFGKLEFRFRSPHAPPRPEPASHSQPAQAGAGAPAQTSGFEQSNRSGPQAGGFEQAGQGARPSGGFDQPDRSGPQAGGFQQATGGFEQPNQGGANNGGFGPQTGGFEQAASGGFGEAGDMTGATSELGQPQSTRDASAQFGAAGGGGASAEATPGEQPVGTEGASPADDNGIKSWDEIAGESDEQQSDPSLTGEDTLARRRESKKQDDEEQTNPLLVGVAVLAIAGLSWFILAEDAPTANGGTQSDESVEEQQPLVVNVDCLGESDCRNSARKAYEVGVERLEKKDAAVTNLFEGYKKLKEATAYLEKAGVEEPPEEFDDLEPRLEKARGELDDLFRNYHVMYHRASKSKNYDEMARALRKIDTYFPDTTSRENKWANQKVREMKKNRDVPDTVDLPD